MLLVIEVADTSLIENRLTKATIYAAAAIPVYWIVKLRDDVVEALGDPDPSTREYRRRERFGRAARLAHSAFGAATIAVDDILPTRG